ncbi:TAP domain-containing protein [Diaporthe helianthi]|uniref:mRNA export factor MEX67 n=1 Tax=Diaporthe helianthi TaxID=158607 RepID=A0A2P5I863_DIAHE|nr:TAP domain-containing protein [Diaporthe helianthi]
MSPPTGPRGGNASSTRQTRSSTAPNRTSRGGIARRGRGSGLRGDRDGDVDMDSGSKPSKSGGGISKSSNSSTRRGNNRSSGAPKSNARLQQNLAKHIDADPASLRKAPNAAKLAANNTTLIVVGLKSSKAVANPDGGVKSLLQFLERKATQLKGPGRPVTIKKSLAKGDSVYILASNQDAEEITKVNNFTFAGAQLTITKSEEGWPRTDQTDTATLSSKAQQDKMILTTVLERRYDVNMKLLNLSALGQDPVLTDMGLFQAKDTAEKTFKVLMVICQDLFKTPEAKRTAIESVSLASNSLDYVGPVFDLAETFPDLLHLDLSSNNFTSMKQLNRWRGRFKRLQTLILDNNPIIQVEPNYTKEVMEWFPKLLNLNNNVVRTAEQIAAQEEKAKASLIPQRGTDFRDVAGLGENFIREFFPLYDTNRDALLSTYYDEHSTFTLAVDTGGPRDTNVPVLPWAPYITFSRNHQRITTETGRFQRYMKGLHIQEIWKKLPATNHPDLATNLEKYIIDCHPMKGLHDPVNHKAEGEDGMIITIHGEFEELEATSGKTGKRSFSRTFVIGPGLPGRNPIRVNSDMLSITPWNAVPLVTVSGQGPSAEEQQQLMVVELSKRTNMVPQFSKMCLETAEWNFDQALLVFEEKRSVLPPDAFIS